MKAILIMALALVLAVPTFAQPYNVFDVTASTTVAFAPVAANTSITSKLYSVAQFKELALSWYLVPGSGAPSVNVIILQANSVNDTPAEWSNPVTITSIVPPPTTNITLTTARGGSRLVLSPSALIAVRINNTSATETVTPTIRLYGR